MNISDKAKGIIDSCRFCWMCRHICPIGNATGLERNTSRARALGASLVVRGAENIKDIIDNIYECSLCGACTNNCMTGWDPKVFIQELKTNAILEGVVPKYIKVLLDKYFNCGNIYGKEVCSCLDNLHTNKTNTLLFLGANTLYNSPNSVKEVIELLEKANVEFTFDNKVQDSGEQLYFLTGKTEETQNVMKKCKEALNNYKTVIVYNPVDLKLFKHEYKEYGIELNCEVVGFNEYLLKLLENGKLNVKKSNNEYTAQDNYAYARDLDDSETIRKIIDKVGTNKEMLLHGKEANLAGHLIMREYMPEVIKQVALDRWQNAKNMDCHTIVTENIDEYIMLNETKTDGYNVKSVEQIILENL